MEKNKQKIQVGDYVKIIKESKKTGVLGAKLKVVYVYDGSVEVAIGNNRVRFDYDDIYQ